MAFNQIQFQHGMSITELLDCLGTEAQCAKAVKQARWPDGFRCPRRGVADYCVIGHGARKLFQCNGCKQHNSLTADRQMEHTKQPLTTGFLCAYLISQAKTGLSALALKRQLDVSYPTSWLLNQKIKHAMARQGSSHKLSALVHNEKADPMHLKRNLDSGFTAQAIKEWARANLVPGPVVPRDGLGCFGAVTEAGCIHMPVVVGDLKPRDGPQFKWLNRVFGKLKPTLAGAFHSLKYSKYPGYHMAGFAYRFNRRFDLRALVARLSVDVARCGPLPKRVVRAQAEVCFSAG